jgi:aromatic ring-opening dioxygenase catalytic subunit (LigB family)
MSELVAGVATVHAPLIVGMPHLPPPERRQAVARGWDRLKEITSGVRPDVILCVASEHITNFLSTAAPPFCVGIGRDNPTQPEFGLPVLRVPGDPEFARGLVEYAYARDFDLAHSSELYLDHGTNLPLHFITPDYDIPVVPLLVNTVWEPMPTAERSHQLGELIADYVANDGADKRVMIMATGGISHWVGNHRHGDMNEEFDRWFLDQIASGSNDRLRALSQREIVDQAGDGGNEIRNWIVTAAAARAAGLEPKVILDETFVPGWNVSVYQVAWQ